jgi:hypothetical protein
MLMSGLDEQINEVPMCPSCKKIPGYWTIGVYKNTDTLDELYIVWFYSKYYIMRAATEPYAKYRGEYREDRIKEIGIQNITKFDIACCSSCNKTFKLIEESFLSDILFRLFIQLYPDKLWCEGKR